MRNLTSAQSRKFNRLTKVQQRIITILRSKPNKLISLTNPNTLKTMYQIQFNMGVSEPVQNSTINSLLKNKIIEKTNTREYGLTEQWKN